MQALINESIAQPRFRTWPIGVFSIFALTLACLGIYGVIAYLVTQRYKEIGIRIALGATSQNILHLILARTLKLTAAGILAGLIAAFFLSKFLNTILFGITVHDPLTFVAVPACLINDRSAGRLFACPARDACRSSDFVALRVTTSLGPRRSCNKVVLNCDMPTPARFKIPLPPSPTCPEGTTLPSDGSIVVVGANGSGKTRLGVWFENSNPERTHRTSAQKSLQFPESIRPMDVDLAHHILRVGDQHGTTADRRRQVRWDSSPETALLNDYGNLVAYLFSDHADQQNKYAEMMADRKAYHKPPETKLQVVKRIWESVLPTRELVLSAAKVEAKRKGEDTKFPAKDLSDGERVIFYHIGEALSVPPDGWLIVDEPELHLHRAIQSRLWDAIEVERNDCVIIYLTHDLDFAASRTGATKVWLRDYANNVWDWATVPNSNDLPEPMLLEMLGSRKPVLFVEGDKGRLDHFIYSKAYPDWTIIPAESCEQVIHATVSFTRLKNLHSNSCKGVIDFDARAGSDVARIQKLGVEVLDFAEIENVLLAEPVLRVIAKRLAHNEEEVVTAVKQRVFKLLEEHQDEVVSRLTASELETAFHHFDATAVGAAALEASFRDVLAKVDPATTYAAWIKKVRRVIEQQDYAGALKLYNNKGLASDAGAVFKTPLVQFVLRFAQTRDSADLLLAIKSVLPKM
jgi:ABC-type dipeptide/oligopeptide/nickel transport system ATPase component